MFRHGVAPIAVWLWVLALVGTVPQIPEQLPDLDVTYIERIPRYPGYRPDYDLPGRQGVPILVDPKTRKPLTAAEAAAIKRWPAAGETVTFTAHVQNRGNGPAPAFEFAWYIDGREAIRGRTPKSQDVGTEVTEQLAWKWQPGRHTVKFVADPLFKVRDLTLTNNSREDATDAWSLIWAVDRVTYEQFLKHRNFLGTRSFEDWAQWHIDHMNHLFDISPTPWDRTGDGKTRQDRKSLNRPITQTSNHPRTRVRCDRVVVVDNVDTAWETVLGRGVAPLDAGYDGAWQFGKREDSSEWAANVDWGLIHEWGHQLGLTDEYALDRPGFQNLTPDEAGDPLLIGHTSSQVGYMMHGHGPTTFSPECMGALLTQYGRRRGYYGDYYYCIPKLCRLQVLDNRGLPVAGAQVAFWQDVENEYGGKPVFSGITDSKGLFTLPNRTAPHMATERGYTQRDNPFGKINVVGPGDVFFIRIQARGHTEFTWLDIAEFNLAYWNFGPESAVFTRRTRIPPSAAPPPPHNLLAATVRDAVRLEWKPIPGARTYRIYHGAPDLYRYEAVGEVKNGQTAFTTKLGNGALHRFAVTAVSVEGAESAFSNTAGAMHFVRPWGIVVTKDGKRLIRDAHYGQAVLQKPDGNTVGLVGSVHYHLEGSYDIAIDPNGRILSAKWGDGYNPKQGFKVQNPDLKLAFEHLAPEGDGPDQFRKPMGIGADSRGHIFVGDTGNDRVQEFTPDGKFVQVIGDGGELRQPMHIAFDKQNRMYVADEGHNRIGVYSRTDQGKWTLDKYLTGIKEPVSVIVDDRGRVFASANREAGVIMWDSSGKIAWKYEGPNNEGLSGPRGLAFDGKGNLLVVDEATLRVLSVKPPP